MKRFYKYAVHCILTFVFVFVFASVEVFAQGIVGGLDEGESEIVFHENFSTATIATTGSATSSQWSFTNTSGAITPTVATAIGSTITMGSNEGYDAVATKKALRIPFTATTNNIILWTPVITVPNSTRAWVRYILFSENALGMTSVTLGAAFDDSPNDFITTAEAGAGAAPFSLSYVVGTYGEGSGITNTTYNYRIVYVDISNYANRTGRLGLRIQSPSASGVAPVLVIDGVTIGKRPTNDDCAGAYQLVNGVNGPFYNTLATGLLPRCNTPSNSNMGGFTMYLNPTSAATRPGDGFEPTTGGGVFSSTSNTVENSTWYKFTTPTLATMNGCNAGVDPTSMQVRLTLENLSCEAPNAVKACGTAGCAEQQQVRIFRSAFSCGSTNTAATEQLTAYTTLGNNQSITLSTASGLAYNSTYYVVFDSNLGNNCRFNIKTETFINGGATPQTPPCTILPITLKDFTATPEEDGTVSLNWATLSERNNDFFTVERSTDGVNYVEIHKQAGAGNSTTEQVYGAVDFLPEAGLNYYRLKQTDFDGNFEYFDPVAVNVIPSMLNMTLIPNPTSREASVLLSSRTRQHIQLQVYDITGKFLFQVEDYINEGNTSFSLPSEKWNSGTYLVRVVTDKETLTEKLIVNL